MVLCCSPPIRRRANDKDREAGEGGENEGSSSNHGELHIIESSDRNSEEEKGAGTRGKLRFSCSFSNILGATS